MKIYLAGKVAEGDWRHGVVDGLQATLLELLQSEVGDINLVNKWPTMPKAILGKHDFVGPYFSKMKKYDGGDKAARMCQQAIRSADLVFAWVTSPNPHGSLFEIGFATGLYKPVVIAAPSGAMFQDMWYARSAVGRTVICDSALYGLEQAIDYAEDNLANGGWFQMTSKFDGGCRECGGGYKVGDPVMVRKGRGARHLDCHKNITNDPNVSDRLAYNGDVIASLREALGKSEKECAMLQARVFELEHRGGKT
jgi:hypothetical protein